MRRYLDSLFLVVFAIVTVGCNRSSQQPYSPLANTAELRAVAPVSELATPPSVVQQSTSSAISLPTVTVTPLPTSTPTPLPYPSRYTRDGTPIEGTPIPAAPQVICLPQGDVIACNDELLDMTFSYPAFMGNVLYTTLRKGGYSGYAYEYAFEGGLSQVGGRSRDFGEGRGPMYTDANGFNGRPAEEFCAGWVAAICQKLSPGALLIGILPQAEWLCSDAMMFTEIPRGILVLDLPQHPLINEFSFSYSFLTAEAEEQFREKWYAGDKSCEPESKAEFGKAMEQLQQDLLAGTADIEIQQRYDAMIQLATSIKSPYIAANP